MPRTPAAATATASAREAHDAARNPPLTPATPLLLAGYGYVARRLAARLAPDATVRAHARSARQAGAPIHSVAALDLDAFNTQTLPVDGATVLYSIAPGGDGDDDPRVARWLELLRGTPTRIAYLSTTGVYGDRAGAAVDEHSPPAPTSPRARRRVAAEARLGDWCARRDVALTVLRVPAIYGPDRLPLARLQRGEPVLVGPGAVPGYRIHVDDLVTAIERAVSPHTPAGTWLLRDDSSLAIGEYLQLVARLAGLPQPQTLDAAEARRRLSPRMLEYLNEHRRLDDRLTRRVLGLRLRYPLPTDGVRASLEEMAWHERPRPRA